MRCVYCQGYGFTELKECDHCRGSGEAHIEPTRSEKLRAAGFTRRPTWRSLPKDGDEPVPPPGDVWNADAD
jgi:DnaJ-class molecular chaperone